VQYQRIFEQSPVAIVLINAARRIVECNHGAMKIIGECRDQAVEDIFDRQSADLIAAVLSRGQTSDPLRACFVSVRSNGNQVRLHGCVDLVGEPGHEPLARVTMLVDTIGQRWIDKTFHDEQLLRRMARTVTEAMWSIEFLEPVDLSVDADDIVRQIFEKDRRWALCNDAMARLYEFPEDLDFNSTPVDRVFPRSPENDVFVKQIIASGYCIDNALSIDFRHDGSSVYVENTVRADIEGDRLLRLWGTARDVTIFHEEQNRLQRQILEMSNILAAIPGGILVIDRQRKLLALNPAVERLLGWKAEELLGKDVQKIIDIEKPLPGGRRWYGCDWQRWSTAVLKRSGEFMSCDVQLAPVGDDSPAEKFVITLRQVLNDAQKSTENSGKTPE